MPETGTENVCDVTEQFPILGFGRALLTTDSADCISWRMTNTRKQLSRTQAAYVWITFRFLTSIDIEPSNSSIQLMLFLQADLNVTIADDASTFYGVNTQFESPDERPITCSTKVCSFGKQVVEKVEVGALLVEKLFCRFSIQERNISDRIQPVRRRSLYLPHPQIANVWIYDQFYFKIETSSWYVHDEQCVGKFHYTSGKKLCW